MRMTHRMPQSRNAARAAFAAATLALVPVGTALAQSPASSVSASPSPVSVAGPPAAPPTIAPGPAPVGSSAPVTAQAPSQPTPPAQTGPGSPTQTPVMVKSASPEDANPFSNVKTTDDRSVKQELPVLEQRLKSVEDKMTAIQQVQLALPADALNGPGGRRAPGAPGSAPSPGDEQSLELEAATFVACVNGKAMFRDSDQKPFFVDAKDANQNEAVRRIGGCKH